MDSPISGIKRFLFWDYPRAGWQYDVMVGLILAFIFITPHIWSYGDKPVRDAGLASPTLVAGDGEHGLVIIVPYRDVYVDPSASDWHVRRALHQAIEPVTGDAVAVVRWETTAYVNGKPTAWKVWAHR